MRYSKMDEIQEKLSQIDANTTDYMFDVRMLMYRFLSEVERVTEEKGINRKTLAKMLNTSPSYITQLFRGNKIINLEMLAKMEKVLGISFDIVARAEDTIAQHGNESKEHIPAFDIQELIKMRHAVPGGFWVFHPVEKTKSEITYSAPTGSRKIVA